MASRRIAAPTRSFEDFQRNPLLTQWEYDFETDTLVFHLQDTWSLTDAVRINAGFRVGEVGERSRTPWWAR